MAPEFDSIQMQFWDERLNAPYEDMLPNVVFSTLTGGFGYLAGLPGMEKLEEEVREEDGAGQFKD